MWKQGILYTTYDEFRLNEFVVYREILLYTISIALCSDHKLVWMHIYRSVM